MTPIRVSIFAAIAAILLLIVILELIRSRRLQERYALLWLVTGVVLLVFAVWRDGLNVLAKTVGIALPAVGALPARGRLHPRRAASLLDRDLGARLSATCCSPSGSRCWSRSSRKRKPPRARTRRSLRQMAQAVKQTQARATRWTEWVAQTRVLTASLVVFVLVLAAIRIWMAHQIATPWIMGDELIYSELARSLADSHQLLVRGASYPIYSVGYPLLVSPAWLAASMATTYMIAKTINVVLMTVALIPVYFWSRRLMRPVYAVVATALVALLPAFVYTGTIMTENGSFPATILAFFAIAWMLERPTLLRQLLALAVVGLAFFVRAQSLVLFVVLPLAVIVKLLFDARVADPGARRRAFVRGWRAYLPLVAIYLFVAVGYGLFQAARGVPLNRGLGAYGGVASAQYSVGDVASWTLEHAAELGLAVAIFPVSALIVLTVLAVSRGANDAAERAFLAVATSAVFIVVVQVAAFASRFSLRVEERYMFFVVPLLFMALALWLDRGLPRPVVTTAVATAVPVLLLLDLPLEKRLNVSITSDTFGFIPLLRLSYHYSIPTVRLLMIAGAVVAALAFALLPRRFARVVLPSALALYLALTTAQVFRTVRDFAQDTRAFLEPAQLNWIDSTLPRGASTGVIFGSTADPFSEAQRMWQAEFWNRSVKHVYDLTPAPAAFPSKTIDARPPVREDSLRSGGSPGVPLPLRVGRERSCARREGDREQASLRCTGCGSR